MIFSSAIKKRIALPGILFFIEVLSFYSYSQSSFYRFENITSEQGIADRIINAIIQDAQGFIWIASVDGLTRYDGYNAVLYRHQANDPYSLSDNEVYALCTDGDGFLWIGTRKGLNRYDAYNNRFETFFHDSTDDNSLAANEIFSLAKDAHGNLWIATYSGGLDKLIKAKKEKNYKGTGYSFLHYRHSETDSSSISSNQVLSVCFDTSGNAWAGTEHGLNIIDAAREKISRFYFSDTDKNSIKNNSIGKIVAAKNGTMWVCGKNMLDNIALHELNGKKSIAAKHFLPLLINDKNDWSVNDFMVDRYNNYWVATNDQGILKFKVNDGRIVKPVETFVNTPSVFSLANTTVFNLYEDNAGIIWIGTAKGISKYVPSNRRFNDAGVFISSSLPAKNITALLYNKNNLWIGSEAGVYVAEDNDPIPSLALPLSEQPGQVNMLYKGNTGNIYVATFANGLFIISENRQHYGAAKLVHINKKNHSLPSNNIYSVAEDKNGKVWLGTYTGLSCYDPHTGKLNNVYVPEGGNVVSAFIIRTLLVDDSNSIWAGTDDGLLLIKDNNVIEKFLSDDKDTNSLSNSRVTVIYEDSRKNIWIGTKAGLNLFNRSKNNFKHFVSQNHITVETIMSIREDEEGNLWLGTNNGLIKFDTGKKKFAKYTIEDGLYSNQFSINASTADTKNNYIYFGTDNGIVSFNPKHIIPNNFIPPVVITDVKILDQPLSSFNDTLLVNTYRREKKLLLKYDQNFFSLEFAALSYNNSKANQYTYILEGVDRQWHNAGTQHFADYTDIRPGHYIFKVKASNNDGIWNEKPAIVYIIINPPWWQTWWFYGLCFLAAVGILYIIYRIRIQQILKVYKLRSSIAKDLHDDVGSALSSIALLSNISEAAKEKAKLKPEEIFSRIGDTSKRMIDLMDDIVWSVNPDNDRFSNMLIRMREYAVEMLESKDIDFSFDIADDIDELRIPMQMRKDYFLIFKEAVNNLAKYSGCSKAVISIKKENKNILTVISDNGKGFNPRIINSGNGLKNMQQRAIAIKAKLDIKTAEGKGTEITMLMPV